MNLDRHAVEIAQSISAHTEVPTPRGAADRAQLKHSAEEFEAVFLAEMLRPIFETIETDGPFGGGSGERVMRSLMVDEYGKAIAKSGGVGIAEAVERELLRIQEV